jgi:hypothetical protein
MFKVFLLSSILATCTAHLNHLDLITLTILDERYYYKVHYEIISTPYSQPFWALAVI